MKDSILKQISALGGNIKNAKNNSIKDDLTSVKFNTVLYRKPIDTPWENADDAEPLWGLSEFIDENQELLKDEKKFFTAVFEKYWKLTDEPYAQHFWVGELFTPFKEGTADYKEWYDGWFKDLPMTEIYDHTKDKTPDFICIIRSYGYPDSYYICLSDPNPENPTVFGTDHEQYFQEIISYGSLEDFLKLYMTKDDFIEIIKKKHTF